MRLEIIAYYWRIFKEAVKRLWNDYLEYNAQRGWFLDPSFEDGFIYQYLLEKDEAEGE